MCCKFGVSIATKVGVYTLLDFMDMEFASMCEHPLLMNFYKKNAYKSSNTRTYEFYFGKTYERHHELEFGHRLLCIKKIFGEKVNKKRAQFVAFYMFGVNSGMYFQNTLIK